MARQHPRSDKTPRWRAWDARVRLSHHPTEDAEVLPPVSPHGPRACAPLAHTANPRLGPGEPGDGVGALLGLDRRPGLAGALAGPHSPAVSPPWRAWCDGAPAQRGPPEARAPGSPAGCRGGA